jgi:hypothetical protein
LDPSQRKHFWVWLASYKKDFLISKKWPWLPFDLIDYLLLLDLKGKNILEYGSGSSTLFWVSRSSNVVSIEHDPVWYSKIKGILTQGSKLDYRLVTPEDSEKKGDPADPDMYFSNSPDFKNKSFKHYVEQIDEFPPGYFDVIMIDGRSRPACIKHSVQRIKPGGVLIVDDADRDYYFKYTQNILSDFYLLKFYGVGPCLDFFITTNLYRNQEK